MTPEQQLLEIFRPDPKPVTETATINEVKLYDATGRLVITLTRDNPINIAAGDTITFSTTFTIT